MGEDTFLSPLRINLPEPVGALSISPSCRDVCLGARKGLFIIDLQSPFDPPRFLPHYAAWEVADVQWNPHTSRANWVVSTSNQKALVWNLESKRGESNVEFWLHGHTRAITDVNWSIFEPEILATCSLDGWLGLWDLRSCSRPIHRFSDWIASAVQVKFSRFSSHQVASAHEERLVVWDLRMGNKPFNNIMAHEGAKIYGLDWSRVHPQEIVTCGVDGWVKAWDVNDDAEESMAHSMVPPIRTPKPVHAFKPYANAPVYRARNLPFGEGVLTTSHLADPEMPAIWKWDDPCKPVETFEHSGAEVDDFVWRFRGGENTNYDDREFQLITWSKDRKLRLYPVGQETLREMGHFRGAPIKTRMTGRGVPSVTTYRAPPPPSSQIQKHRSLSPSSIRPFTRGRPTASPLSSSPLAEFSYPAHHQQQQQQQQLQQQQQQQLLRRQDHSFALATSFITGMGFSLPAQTVRTVRNERLAWMEGVDFKGRDESVERVKMTSTLGLRDSSAERSRSESVDVPRQFALGDEIRELGRLYPKCTFEKMSFHPAFFTLSLYTPLAKGRLSFVRANFSIPATYPQRGQPTIEIEKSTDITPNDRAYLLKNLRKIVANKGSKRKRSLRDCVEFLVGEERKKGTRKDWESESESDVEDRERALRNVNVPLPARCGARFSRDGRLVAFFPDSEVLRKPELMVIASSVSISMMERSLSLRREGPKDDANRLKRGFGVGLFTSGKGLEDEDSDPELKIGDNPIQVTERRHGSDGQRTTVNTRIYLDNVSEVLGSFSSSSPMSTDFVLEGNPEQICVVNSQLAAQSQKYLMAKLWATLAVCISRPDVDPKRTSKLGRATESYIRVVLQYLRHTRDVEALGLLACWLEIVRRDIFEEDKLHRSPLTESSTSGEEPARLPRRRAASMAPIEEETSKKSASAISLGRNPWVNISGLFSSKRSESQPSSLLQHSGDDIDSPGSHFQVIIHDSDFKPAPVPHVPKERQRTQSARSWSVKSRQSTSGISLGRTLSTASERTTPRTRKLRTTIKVIEHDRHAPPNVFWATMEEQIALEEHRFAYADLLYSSNLHQEHLRVLKATRSAVDPAYWEASTAPYFLEKVRHLFDSAGKQRPQAYESQPLSHTASTSNSTSGSSASV
ncbi:hypothetical protein BT69DRAFT_1349489 [Atractiella rhizophila]|nr:hypothetical protein BT69DRAFT_1349489 [Atractiella rhizophila]